MASQPPVTVPHARTAALLLVASLIALLGAALTATRTATGVSWQMMPSDFSPVPQAAQPMQPPLSSLSLPVTVPLSGVREAVNTRIPREFARIDRDQRVLGGAASVHIHGVVARRGDIRIVPSASSNSLELEVPLTARFTVRPEMSGASWASRLEQSLSHDISGEATVRLSIRPYIQPNWEAGAQVSSSLSWTDPLAVELAGSRLSVASLAEHAVQAQLERVTQEVARTVSDALALRTRAQQLWGQMGQPWPLPLEGTGVGPAYAQLMPQTLTVAGLGVRDDAVQLTLQAEGVLRGELGRPPAQPPTLAPLPPLRIEPQAGPSELHLRIPVSLPFAELSALATAAARREMAALELPGGFFAPKLRLEDLRIEPQSGQAQHLTLTARVAVEVLGGVRYISAEVSGRPWLRPDGQEITLEQVRVKLLGGPEVRLLGPLLAARLEDTLARSARFDLGPRLDSLEDTIAARLPYAPTPALQLRGNLGRLRLDDLRVTPTGLEVTAAADGALDVLIKAEALAK